MWLLLFVIIAARRPTCLSRPSLSQISFGS